MRVHLMTVHRVIALVMLTLSFWASAQSEASSYPLKSLRSALQKGGLAPQHEVASIAMLFQPQCPWCKKQAKGMAQLQHDCGRQLNLSVIGIKGDRQQLKRELKHFDRTLTALQSDTQFLRKVGGVEAAPTTLFFDKAGKLLLKRRGYMDPHTLQRAAQALSGNHCQG